MDQKRILVIMPAYNETGNIKRAVQDVLKELLSSEFSLDVLVVNDGSTDDTQKEAESAGVSVVALPVHLGIGGAVQTGFQYALKNGFDIAVQIDGDGQHDVRFLKDLTGPLVDQKADMVIGSRFLPPYLGYQSSVIRRMGIQFFSGLVGFLTGCQVMDPTSGFRAFNRRTIGIFAEHYPQDYPEPEAIVTARRFGIRVMEVPVQMRKRDAGVSSIRYLKTLYYMVKVTSAILLNMIKKRPE